MLAWLLLLLLLLLLLRGQSLHDACCVRASVQQGRAQKMGDQAWHDCSQPLPVVPNEQCCELISWCN